MRFNVIVDIVSLGVCLQKELNISQIVLEQAINLHHLTSFAIVIMHEKFAVGNCQIFEKQKLTHTLFVKFLFSRCLFLHRYLPRCSNKKKTDCVLCVEISIFSATFVAD